MQRGDAMDIIDLIDSRISQALSQTNYLRSIPCEVLRILNNGNVEVSTVSSDTIYTVPNLTGTALSVGQNVQLFYQGSLSHYKMMFIGGVVPNELSLNYVSDIKNNILLTSNSKPINEIEIQAYYDVNAFFNININYDMASGVNTVFEIYIDDEKQKEITTSAYFDTPKQQFCYSFPFAISQGLHKVRLNAIGDSEMIECYCYVMGIGIEKYEPTYDDTTDADYIYNVDNGETTVYYYIGNSSRPRIPDTIGGGDTKVLSCTSFNYSGINRVLIPDGTETIE